MAASDNLSDQFGGDHKTGLANIESTHEVDINPMGIRTKQGKSLPVANLFLQRSGQPGSDGGGSGYLTAELMNEEGPDRTDSITLFPKSGDVLRDNNVGVTTHEKHVYNQESGKDEVHTFHRTRRHPDLDSALRHLDSAGKQRSEYLSQDSVNGPHEAYDESYLEYPDPQTPVRPPSTILHGYSGRALFSGGSYLIDTGTRERIQDKDQ